MQLHVRVLRQLTMRSFVDGQPGTTPENVEFLLPPRQSRGNSHCISRVTNSLLGRAGYILLKN